MADNVHRLQLEDLARFRALVDQAIAADFGVDRDLDGSPSLTSNVPGLRLVLPASFPGGMETFDFLAASRGMAAELLDEIDLLRSERKLDEPDARILELVRARRDNDRLREIVDKLLPALRDLSDATEDMVAGALERRR